MSIENVREVAFEVTLEGKGIVQTDQSLQRYQYVKSEGSAQLERLDTDNVIFAKANYYNNPNYNPGDEPRSKKYLRTIKISGAGLRHAIHEDVMPFHTPQFFQNPAIRKEILSSMDYILRGYMYAPCKGSSDGETIRRASAYVISDAEEVGGAASSMEVCSTSGERSNTSLFYKETIGDSKYVATGSIDMAQLQFISASPNADRMALNDDDIRLVSTEMIRKYGENSIREGYYHLLGATKPLAERGLLLSDEMVNNMVTYLFERIAAMYLNKQSSYAKVTKIRAKVIVDPTVDFVGDPDGWVEVYDAAKKVRNFNLDVKPHRFYAETSLEEIERHNIIAEDIAKLVKAATDTAKAEKAAAKKNKD